MSRHKFTNCFLAVVFKFICILFKYKKYKTVTFVPLITKQKDIEVLFQQDDTGLPY